MLHTIDADNNIFLSNGRILMGIQNGALGTANGSISLDGVTSDVDFHARLNNDFVSLVYNQYGLSPTIVNPDYIAPGSPVCFFVVGYNNNILRVSGKNTGEGDSYTYMNVVTSDVSDDNLAIGYWSGDDGELNTHTR